MSDQEFFLENEMFFDEKGVADEKSDVAALKQRILECRSRYEDFLDEYIKRGLRAPKATAGTNPVEEYIRGLDRVRQAWCSARQTLVFLMEKKEREDAADKHGLLPKCFSPE